MNILKRGKKAKVAEARSTYGGWCLEVGGIIVAMEGEKCRDILPESALEPIPEDELERATIDGKPVKDMPRSVVRFFRGGNWCEKSLKWAADRINRVVSGKAKPYSQSEAVEEDS